MTKRYRCPYCGKLIERSKLPRHIDDKHEEMIPEGFTPLRVAFNSINYPKNMDYSGKCTECGGPTNWDENKGRYDRQCGKKACHDSFIKNFEANMMRTKGVTRITKTVEGQEKMLANRGISKEYTFSDGSTKVYTGSYEGKALEFMDKVLNCKSEDIMMPGPPMQYMYNGELHWYIPDIFYIPYYFIVEVKDGGDNPNTRNMPEYRAKQIAKEKHIIENTDYNYLRLTNNDFSQLLSTMADLKLQLVENNGERVININENMFGAMQGMFPMHDKEAVYIINYTPNNSFLGDDSRFAVSDSPKFDSVFYRNEDGKLAKGNRDILIDSTYDLYVVKNTKSKFEASIKGLVGEFIEEGFLYETIFDKKMYTPDQIKFEPMAEASIDLYTFLKESMIMTHRYTLGNESKNIIESVDLSTNSDSTYISFNKVDLDSGKVYIESSIPGLVIESGNDIQKYIMAFAEYYSITFNKKEGEING